MSKDYLLFQTNQTEPNDHTAFESVARKLRYCLFGLTLVAPAFTGIFVIAVEHDFSILPPCGVLTSVSGKFLRPLVTGFDHFFQGGRTQTSGSYLISPLSTLVATTVQCIEPLPTIRNFLETFHTVYTFFLEQADLVPM